MYTFVATVQHCVILAQSVGQDPNTGEEIPSFFAGFMITKDGKPACGMSEAAAIQRICKNRSAMADLIGFCQGYSVAATEGKGRGMSPQDWNFPGTIYPEHVKTPDDKEMLRLRAWPDRPDEPKKQD